MILCLEFSICHVFSATRLGGIESQLQELWEATALPLLNPWYTAVRGALLTGPPGSGKTASARWLAKKLRGKATVLARKAADCLGRFHGDAERELKNTFEDAKRLAPCVVFFDELDAFASDRSVGNQQASQRGAIATMLSLMDDLPSGVAVVGTTVRPSVIDPALRRPGRLAREIKFGLWDSRARYRCLKSLAEPLNLDESFLLELGERSETMNGSDLEALCGQAVLHACKRSSGPENVQPQGYDFLVALNDIRATASLSLSIRPEKLPKPLVPALQAQLEKLQTLMHSGCSAILLCGSAESGVPPLERALLAFASSTCGLTIHDVTLERLMNFPSGSLTTCFGDEHGCSASEGSIVRLAPLNAWAASSTADGSIVANKNWHTLSAALMNQWAKGHRMCLLVRCPTRKAYLPNEIASFFSVNGVVQEVPEPSRETIREVVGKGIEEIAAHSAAGCPSPQEKQPETASTWFDKRPESEGKEHDRRNAKEAHRLVATANKLRLQIREEIKAAACEIASDGHFAVARWAFEGRSNISLRRKRKRNWPMGAIVDFAARGMYTTVSQLSSDIRFYAENRSETPVESSCESHVADAMLSKVNHLQSMEDKALQLEDDASSLIAGADGVGQHGQSQALGPSIILDDFQALVGKTCILRPGVLEPEQQEQGERPIVTIVKSHPAGLHCVRQLHRSGPDVWIDVDDDVEEWIHTGIEGGYPSNHERSDACRSVEGSGQHHDQRETAILGRDEQYEKELTERLFAETERLWFPKDHAVCGLESIRERLARLWRYVEAADESLKANPRELIAHLQRTSIFHGL